MKTALVMASDNGRDHREQFHLDWALHRHVTEHC